MTAAPREIELKLEFNPADAGRIKRHLHLDSEKTRHASEKLVSIYFDTPDRELERAGLSLRVRRIGKRYVQTIKTAAGRAAGLFDRAEWEHDVPGPLPDFARAKGSALEPLLSRQPTDSVRPMFETRIARTQYRVSSHGSLIDVALDRGEIDTGERRLAVSELEFSLVRGELGELFRLARSLAELVPLRLCTKSKGDRGYELVRNDVDPVDRAGDVHVAPAMTAEEAFRVIGRGCLRQLAANEPAMLRHDGEALHQMRIALRRLRAAISTFSTIVADNESERIKAELRWITAELGPARDLDVFISEVLTPLRSQNPREPGLADICRNFERRRARAYKDAAEAIWSARFRMLCLDVGEWVETGSWTRNDDELLRLRREQPITVLACEELARRRNRIRKKGKTLKQLSTAERHRLRIRGKKLRYAVEFFADVFPGKKSAKRRKAALSALKALQDALGALNDIATREKLASHVALAKRPGSKERTARERAFAAGVIFGEQEAHVERMLDIADGAYAKFLSVEAFWK
jgi:inorganic triphosphatase YgiF